MPEPTCDLVWLTGLCAEIAEDISGRTLRIRKHHDRPAAFLDSGGDRVWLFDATPSGSYIARTRPEEADAWVPWSGRRAEGALLVGASVPRSDRVIRLDLRWRSRLGDDERFAMVMEFGGRRTNLLLLDAAERIIDVLRPVRGSVNRVRQVLPGRSYEPPPALGRVPVDGPWDWSNAGKKTVEEFLLGAFFAMSARWAREILVRANVDQNAVAEELDQAGRRHVEETARSMVDERLPHIIRSPDGRAIDHVGFRPSLPAGEVAESAALFAAAARTVRDERARIRDDAPTRDDALERRAARHRSLERRLEHLRDDLRRADRADDFSRRADLLMAHIADVPERATSITVRDWHETGEPEMTIPLDPDVAVPEQAERLYRRARKLRESVEHIHERLARTERDLQRLDEERAGAEDTVKRTREDGEEHIAGERHLPGDIHPRRYRTRDGGWLVLVGRNDRENDMLSLKVAAQNDFWFHAHGCPGSHVVLRLEGRKDNPSRHALGEAAAVAAYWSKQRGASKVGVSYTLAKHVSKPRGAKPGTVTIRQEKLLTVPPALLPLEDDVVRERESGAS